MSPLPPLSSARQLMKWKMTTKIAGNNSVEMQSQCLQQWLNIPERSLFTVKIHEAVTSGSAQTFLSEKATVAEFSN